jgi:hypothetical protein
MRFLGGKEYVDTQTGSRVELNLPEESCLALQYFHEEDIITMSFYTKQSTCIMGFMAGNWPLIQDMIAGFMGRRQ